MVARRKSTPLSKGDLIAVPPRKNEIGSKRTSETACVGVLRDIIIKTAGTRRGVMAGTMVGVTKIVEATMIYVGAAAEVLPAATAEVLPGEDPRVQIIMDVGPKAKALAKVGGTGITANGPRAKIDELREEARAGETDDTEIQALALPSRVL
mmetsp:Transcript_21246/g.44310  ORF Transcript_21246/g.44310 Transcript_21246/m.44310 type:complete len:152 (+) Transcript_21246:1663-2118(+)